MSTMWTTEKTTVIRRRLPGRHKVALVVGSVVALFGALIPSTAALAAAPNSPVVTDVVKDDTARTLKIYFTPAATGSAATSYTVSGCNDYVTVTINNTVSPLTVNYSSFCVSSGGIDGYLAAQPSWASVYLSVAAVNAQGSSSGVTVQVKATMPSIPQITSTVAYKDGCLANYTLRSYPSWATSVGIGTWDDPNAQSGGSAVASKFDPVTGTGSFFHSYSSYSSWGQDRAISVTADVSAQVGQNWLYGSSPRSAEFSCADNPSGATSPPSTPTISVRAGNGSFNIDWSVANTGSHPIMKAYLALFTSETNSGPTSIYTSNPVNLANVSTDCLQENPQTVFKYNVYCQSPTATEAEITDAGLRTSGTISSVGLVDGWSNPIPIVNGRTYYVALRVVSTGAWNPDATTMSSASTMVEIFPGAVPTVTSVSPSSGPVAGGTTITVTGTGFAAGATVTVGGNPCTNVNVVSATSITCTAPQGTVGTASVVVSVQTRTNSANSLFTYSAPTTTTSTTTSTSTTTTAPPTTTTVPMRAAAAPAGAPTLVTSLDQGVLEAAPGTASAVINGKTVETEVVKAAATSSDADLLAAGRTIVNIISDLTPSGSTNPVKLVATSDGPVLTKLITNPDDPTEKLDIPVESVTLVKAGASAVLISALNQTNLPAEVAPGGAIEVTRGGIMAARAFGLGSSETGEIVLMSTPRLLTTFTVDKSGAYSGQVPLPKDIAFGSHTVVMATKNAKVSLGIKLVHTRMQFRIKRVISTRIFRNRAGVKADGGKVTVTAEGRCRASNTRIRMGNKAGGCYITVRQAAKGSYKAVYFRFTVSVVRRLVRSATK